MRRATPKKQVDIILTRGYGVNSGVYAHINPSIEMRMNKYGLYEPVFTKSLSSDDYERLARVDMMSDYSANETQLAEKLFADQSEGVLYDSVIGYYTGLYAGHVVDGGYRERASSGGMTSWILAELIKRKMIDGVIHMHAVDPKENNDRLFKYAVSISIEEIQKGAKSRYYPGELSEVLQVVRDNPTKKYAIVGIPEFITEIRLLSEIDEQVRQQIVFTIGLVCGHQKSAKYAEALAWQHGILPGDLQSIDFRLKQPDSTAIDYLHEFTGRIDGKMTTITKGHKDLFCGSWAYGMFKAKFSDFTDNVFNETADIVLGDAWLEEYDGDGMGNNIVIVRNRVINEIVESATKDGILRLDTIDVDTVKRSQRGLIHHGRDELPYRLHRERMWHGWVPIKRFDKGEVPRTRRKIQGLRYRMAIMSHRVYYQAVGREDWAYFERKMFPYMKKYKQLYEKKGNWESQIRSGLSVKEVIHRVKVKVRVRTRLRALKQKLRIRTRYREMVVTRIEKRRQTELVKNSDGVILTLTGYFNYGNIIQRYALQEYLRQKGYKFLSYAREQITPDDKRFKYTAEFVKRAVDRKVFSKDDNFPVYIVGSDQVWRNWHMPEEQGDILYYFYDFLGDSKAKRIAYAASFGVDNLRDAEIDNELSARLKPLAQKFDAVSMRERAGVDIVKDAWGVNADLVVDPTMLLDKAQYSRLIEDSHEELGATAKVFAYILAMSDQKKEFVDRLAGRQDAEIIHPKGLDVLPPVERWLKGFRDAEFVVTDSFHGTVFAIINNTPFVVIENKYGGVARITTLLETFGLGDRVVTEENINTLDLDSLNSIDWKKINRKLETLRDKSGGWLVEAINEGRG